LIADRRNCTAAGSGDSRGSVAAGRVDLGFVHCPRELMGVVGVVLQKIDVHVERDEEGLVLGPQHALQELASCFLLKGQHALLAPRGVEHNAERKRLVGFRNEVFERLRRLVLNHGAVVPGEVRYEFAALVLDGEKQIDQVNGQFESGDGRLVSRRSRSGAHRGSIRRRSELGRCRQP